VKLDRLLSIIILLLNRNKVLAQELADQFEVSVRTIYRDIEAINQAGIPVVTHQGAGGGIALMEGYRLDRNLLTDEELATIATALRSLSTSQAGPNPELLLEKIASVIPESRSMDFDIRSKQLIVDLSSWGRKGYLEEKLKRLSDAVERTLSVGFTYCSPDGRTSERIVEPHTLVLKGQSWYLYAYCKQREEFRFFKLYRMRDVVLLERQPFERRAVSPESLPWNAEWFSPERSSVRPIALVLSFSKSSKHLAEEWFGVEALIDSGDGRYTVTEYYPEDRWLYGFILSFGPEVEVLEPPHIREKIQKLAEATAHIYSGANRT